MCESKLDQIYSHSQDFQLQMIENPIQTGLASKGNLWAQGTGSPQF